MLRAGAVLLAALTACGRPAPAPAPGPDAQATAAAESIAVTLERTPCFGTCPVYRVTIMRSGEVRFHGKQHVAHTGLATVTIPTPRVDSLLLELEAGGYFGFADAYVMDSPACGMYATDSPTVITSVRVRDGETKTIRHDRGCSAAPRELSRLEQRIDDVAGTAKWTMRR